MFLGNITTGIFWKEHADRTKDPRIIAHAMAGIIAADRWFTIPGVLIIVLAGISTAIAGHLPLLRTGWIFWSLVLFTLSGVAFMGWLAPIQRRMLRLMEAGAASGQPDWNAYRRLSGGWAFWGRWRFCCRSRRWCSWCSSPRSPGCSPGARPRKSGFSEASPRPIDKAEASDVPSPSSLRRRQPAPRSFGPLMRSDRRDHESFSGQGAGLAVPAGCHHRKPELHPCLRQHRSVPLPLQAPYDGQITAKAAW